MNTKIIAAIVIIIILAIAIIAYVHFSSANPSVATISIDPVTSQLQTASIGQTVSVNITVSNVQKLWGWDFPNLTFNSSVLNLTQVQEGPFMKSKASTFFISTSDVSAVLQGDIPDTIDAFSENTTINGSGVLVTLTFTVLSAGTSPIDFTTATLYNPTEIQSSPTQETGVHQQIHSTTINGTVIIGNITP